LLRKLRFAAVREKQVFCIQLNSDARLWLRISLCSSMLLYPYPAFGFGIFRSAAPSMWNRLAYHIRVSTTPSSFRRHLKTWLSQTLLIQSWHWRCMH